MHLMAQLAHPFKGRSDGRAPPQKTPRTSFSQLGIGQERCTWL